MSALWQTACNAAYSDIDASDTGLPSPAVIQALHEAGSPDMLRSIALLTACRAMVYPQISPNLLSDGTLVFQALRARLSGAPSGPAPNIRAWTRLAPGGTAEEEAASCVGHAVIYSLAPDPATLGAMVRSMHAAQRLDPRQPRASRLQMIGWMDDVVSRAPGLDVSTVLSLAEHCLAGTLQRLPSPYYLEGVGDDAGDLEVWATEAKTRRLAAPILKVAEPQLAGRKLTVRIRPGPDRALDRFRVGYLFEHFIHRVFLGDLYRMRYDAISYESEATGDSWIVPA